MRRSGARVLRSTVWLAPGSRNPAPSVRITRGMGGRSRLREGAPREQAIREANVVARRVRLRGFDSSPGEARGALGAGRPLELDVERVQPDRGRDRGLARAQLDGAARAREPELRRLEISLVGRASGEGGGDERLVARHPHRAHLFERALEGSRRLHRRSLLRVRRTERVKRARGPIAGADLLEHADGAGEILERAVELAPLLSEDAQRAQRRASAWR